MSPVTNDRQAIWHPQPLPGLELLSPKALALLAPPHPQIHWPFAAMGTLTREKQHEISLAPSSGTDPLITVSEARQEPLRPPNLDHWLVDPLPTDFWASWLQRNGPLSVKPLCLYVGRCPPLGRLRDEFSASVFKVGTTSDLQRRLQDLNSSQYASWTAHGDRWTREDGFDAWSFEETRINRLPNELSPLTVQADHLEVRLPPTMSGKGFETMLNNVLRTVAIDNWVRQKAVAKSLIGQGLSPTVGIRATQKIRCGKPNYRETSELVFFRRRFDWSALVAIAEDVIARQRQ